MSYFQLPFLTLELYFESSGSICGRPKVFSSRNPMEFSAIGSSAVYTLQQAVRMAQFSAEDRPTDIFHTSPVMPTFSYAEQQFLKWVAMFQYKLCHSFTAALDFFFNFFFFTVNLLILKSNFQHGERKINVSRGYIYIF